MARTFTLALTKIIGGVKQPDTGRTVTIVSVGGSTLGTATETPVGSGQYELTITSSTYGWWYIDGVPQFGYSNNSPFWLGTYDNLSGSNLFVSSTVTANTVSANLLLAHNFQTVTASQDSRLGGLESSTSYLATMLTHYAVLSGFNIFTNANSISAGSITSIGSISAYGGMSANNAAFRQVRTSDSISAGAGLSGGNTRVNQLQTLGPITAGTDIYLHGTNTIHFGGDLSTKLDLFDDNYKIGIEDSTLAYDADTTFDQSHHLFRTGGDERFRIGSGISATTSITTFAALQSNDFNWIDPIVGYRISEGMLVINTIIATNLHVKAFIADIEQALAGSQIIAKSVAKLSADVTLTAPVIDVNFTVESFEGYANMNVFVAGDIIRMRQFTRTGTSLDVADAWLQIKNTPPTYDDNGTHQTWTATLLNGGGFVAKKGQLVLDYGIVGNGVYETVAVGATGPGYPTSPYSQIVTWKTSPYVDPYITVRIGSLTGITDTKFGALTGIGMYASGNVYFCGTVNALTGYFRGTVTAQSGYIGNWNLDSSHLWSYVDNGGAANANRAELYASNADGSNGPPVIRAYQYDSSNGQYGYAGLGQIYRQNAWRNEFGFVLANDFHGAPYVIFAKDLGTGTLSAAIAGWNFDNGKFYNGTDVVLDATNKKVSVKADAVKMYYTSDSDYGIVGTGFQLGSTNQIANWTFDTAKFQGSATIGGQNNVVRLATTITNGSGTTERGQGFGFTSWNDFTNGIAYCLQVGRGLVQTLDTDYTIPSAGGGSYVRETDRTGFQFINYDYATSTDKVLFEVSQKVSANKGGVEPYFKAIIAGWYFNDKMLWKQYNPSADNYYHMALDSTVAALKWAYTTTPQTSFPTAGAVLGLKWANSTNYLHLGTANAFLVSTNGIPTLTNELGSYLYQDNLTIMQIESGAVNATLGVDGTNHYPYLELNKFVGSAHDWIMRVNSANGNLEITENGTVRAHIVAGSNGWVSG